MFKLHLSESVGKHVIKPVCDFHNGGIAVGVRNAGRRGPQSELWSSPVSLEAGWWSTVYAEVRSNTHRMSVRMGEAALAQSVLLTWPRQAGWPESRAAGVMLGGFSFGRSPLFTAPRRPSRISVLQALEASPAEPAGT
jgi:hypothetical protein